MVKILTFLNLLKRLMKMTIYDLYISEQTPWAILVKYQKEIMHRFYRNIDNESMHNAHIVENHLKAIYYG